MHAIKRKQATFMAAGFVGIEESRIGRGHEVGQRIWQLIGTKLGPPIGTRGIRTFLGGRRDDTTIGHAIQKSAHVEEIPVASLGPSMLD
jgi:hypothetical protein